MEKKPNGTLIRLALLLEREARFAGVDIEPETTKIIEKLGRNHEAERKAKTGVETPFTEF
jgi:hypothetical protein